MKPKTLEDEIADLAEHFANTKHEETGQYPTDAQCDAYEARIRRILTERQSCIECSGTSYCEKHDGV